MSVSLICVLVVLCTNVCTYCIFTVILIPKKKKKKDKVSDALAGNDKIKKYYSLVTDYKGAEQLIPAFYTCSCCLYTLTNEFDKLPKLLVLIKMITT